MEIKKSGTAKGAEGGFKLPEARREVKKRKRKKLVTAFIIAVPIVLTAVWLLFDKLFVIRHFEMTGNGEYSEEEARLAAEEIGIKQGSHMFGFDEKTAESEAKYRLPRFDTVEIELKLPDTVIIKVKEAEPVMYTVFGENGYVLSEGLRIISAHSDVSDCETMGVARLYIDGITKCVAGEFLETNNKNGEIAKLIYAVLKEEGIAAEVTSIDVTDKFDLKFEYKKQFEVRLGDDENLTVKIRYMKAIVNELKPDDSGVIDVSDDEYRDATFKPYSKM